MSRLPSVRRRRREWTVAMAVMAALALVGAPAARSALGPRYGGELRIAVGDIPAALDPSVPRGTGERLLAGLAHETLLGVDEEGRPRPALAQSWSSAADGREWTLRLGAATFHDGAELSTADAVRSLRRFLKSSSPAAAHLARTLDGGDEFRRGQTDLLAGVTASDSARLVLRFRAPLALPLAALAAPAAAVVSAGGAGAGPFAPTTPLSARGLSAVAFGRHVRGRPFLDAVRVVAAVPDRATEAADVGASFAPPPGPSGTLMLVLDPAAPAFASERTRAVVAASVDRAQLARRFLPGGEPAEGLLSPLLLAPGPAAAPGPPVGEATLSGRVTLRVASDVPTATSQRVVAHLAALGAEVQAVAMPAPRAATAGGPRLVVWYPEVAEAGLALEELAGLADSREARDFLAAADGERSSDRRRAALLRAEEALRASHVLVPLALVPLRLGPRAGVHGLRTTAAGVLVVEDAWVEP